MSAANPAATPAPTGTTEAAPSARAWHGHRLGVYALMGGTLLAVLAGLRWPAEGAGLHTSIRPLTAAYLLFLLTAEIALNRRRGAPLSSGWRLLAGLLAGVAVLLLWPAVRTGLAGAQTTALLPSVWTQSVLLLACLNLALGSAPRTAGLRDGLGLLQLLLSWAPLLGHVYDLPTGTHLLGVGDVSLPAAILCFGFTVLHFFSDLYSPMRALVFDQGMAGYSVRRLLLVLLPLLVALGGMRLWGELAGWYGAREGLVYLLSSASLVCALGVLALGAQVRRREADFAAHQRLLDAIVEGAGDAIYAKDEEGRYLLVNPVTLRMMNAARESVLGHKDVEVLPFAMATRMRALDMQVMAHGQPLRAEERMHTADGDRIVRILKTPLHDDQGRVYGVIGVDQDITAERQHERDVVLKEELERALAERTQTLEQANRQLLHAEKLAAIGQLAAGVAHEINNPIGFVQSNLNTLDEYVEDLLRVVQAYERWAELHPQEGQELRQLCAAIDLDFLREDAGALVQQSRQGLARVAKIVQDLKAFSHSAESERWEVVDVHVSIESALNIAHNEIKYRADVIRQFATLPPIECQPDRLVQVWVNLLVNAAQAMGETRGTITLRTGTQEGGIWIECADSGAGIPEAVRARIFDPFFTTKPIGQGTGLGLSVSFGIIQKHHGQIHVRSTPGSGTVFRIELPVRQPAPAEPGART